MIRFAMSSALRPGEFGGVWIATALLFAACAALVPGSVQRASLQAMLPFAAMLALVAVGQTLVIQQRGLDLSASGAMALAGVLVASFGSGALGGLVAVVGTLVVAVALGAFNGACVARLGITPIVATLATNALLTGAVFSISGGSPVAVDAALGAFSHRQVFGLPTALFLSLLFIAIVTLVMRHTVLGRRFVAVGANRRAAAAAGIAVRRYEVGAYAAAAGCFGLAGILYAGFIGSASHTAGENYLLPGIAAVILGGTSLGGGRGSVVASGVAALFMTQLGQAVLALGAGTAVQLFVQAAVIVVALVLRRGLRAPRAGA